MERIGTAWNVLAVFFFADPKSTQRFPTICNTPKTIFPIEAVHALKTNGSAQSQRNLAQTFSGKVPPNGL